MKKLFLIFNFLFLIFNFSFAQPAIQWQKCLGGTADEVASSIQQTADGGYIVAGMTNSNDGDVTAHHGNYDYWVVKLDSTGNIQWQKCLGGIGWDQAISVEQTADGGYIVAGYTRSNDGDVTGNHGQQDSWIVKLDNSGNILWKKCLGGTGFDGASSVQKTSDGGYIVAGRTDSNDGDVTGNHGQQDSWIVKLDSSGNILWQKCLGGSSDDGAFSVEQASDGGYIVAGYTRSNDGDVTGNHGYYDCWIVKLDTSGNIQWQKCLGGTNWDRANSIEQTADGGYIVAGYTLSNNGDVTSNHDTAGLYTDYWVVKLDGSGNIQWQKCLGGTGPDEAFSVQQTIDGGLIVAGWTQSNDGNVTGLHANGIYSDYWVVKLNNSGNIQWQKCLGGTNYDQAFTIQQSTDGGYIVAGYTESNDGDVMGYHGNSFPDYWIVKLSPYVGIKEETNNAVYNISPNPFTSNTVISFNSPVYNATFSVYNLLGEKVAEVASINGDSFEFNRGNLTSGVYVFEVRDLPTTAQGKQQRQAGKNKSIARGKAVVY